MADRTGVEWADATWGPVTGCTQVSPGCGLPLAGETEHGTCYALTLTERFRGTPGHYFEHGFDVQLRPAKLDEPFGWRRPRKVFVCPASDLFQDAVPTEYIARVFAVMAAAKRHTFQVLTKRHGRLRSLLRSAEFVALVDQALTEMRKEGLIPATSVDSLDGVTWPLPNVWVGVSVEDQKHAALRVPALLGTPAAVRWLSCEPLLGPVDLTPWLKQVQTPACDRCDPGGPLDWHSGHLWGRCRCACHPPVTGHGAGRIGWVVAGGESGHGARPMHPAWVRSLRDQSAVAGVPFYFKQWGGWAPATPGGWYSRTVQLDGELMYAPRSKKLNTLDDRTHLEFPEPGDVTGEAVGQ